MAPPPSPLGLETCFFPGFALITLWRECCCSHLSVTVSIGETVSVAFQSQRKTQPADVQGCNVGGAKAINVHMVNNKSIQ